MSGIFGSTTIKGNRLTEFSQTSATVGIVIPFGYGRFTSPGNVIWAPLPPKEHYHKKRQGKGGVKQEVYTYTLSYGVAFAKGPIFGYWWIKRNGKVVWTQDPNAQIEDKDYAAKWAQKATFYYGTEQQLPDSTMEAYEGSGQVSAHRGLAYIVVEDDDVTDGAGAVPTYEACVIASAPDVYLTSWPYPTHGQDAFNSSGSAVLSYFVNELETFSTSFAALDGELKELIVTYDYPEPAETFGSSFAALDGELWSYIRTYSAPPPAEQFESVFAAGDGAMWNSRVDYTALSPAENFESSFLALDGSLI